MPSSPATTTAASATAIAAAAVAAAAAVPSGGGIASRPALPLLDLLACPVCKAAVEIIGPAPAGYDGDEAAVLRCQSCARSYRLDDGAVPVLLPDEALDYEPAGPSRALKAHVQERFAMIDRTLPQPYGTFATFLNLGYVANESPRRAVRGPKRAAFNANSTELLFEVIGDCDLDHRRVAELGCGRGGNVAMIQRFYAPERLAGLDLSAANAAFCHAHHTLACGGFVVGDVEHLPLRDASVDVVLNLESSHYYPDLERFLHETWRALAPGGDFLYADILPADVWARAERWLAAIGFDCLRHDDISGNVLLSCTAIARIRDAQQQTGLYDTFLVVPGSAEFAALERGDTRYKTLHLRKA